MKSKNLFFLSHPGLEPNAFRCLIPACDEGNSDPLFGDVPEDIFPEDDDDEVNTSFYQKIEKKIENVIFPGREGLLQVLPAQGQLDRVNK